MQPGQAPLQDAPTNGQGHEKPTGAAPGRTHLIRLDRPDRGNALADDLVLRLRAELAEAVADERTGTVVLIGDGRNFCTGFDLSDLEATDDAGLLARFVNVELLLDDIWRSPVQTVAIGHGRTWGAGADLFAACDHRIALPSSNFRFPGARFGLVLGSRRLAERIGSEQARRLTCNGESLDADEALRMHLATALADTIDEAMGMVAPPCVDRQTMAAIREATRADDRDADLAMLVRSAARPGLRTRIIAYQQALRRQSKA